MPTDSEALAEITEIMANANLRRTRGRRDALDAIEAVLEKAEPTEPTSDGRPPLAGPQATVDVWRSYAEGMGINVPDGAKRADIIALVDASEDEPEPEPEEKPAVVTTVVSTPASA